MTEFFPAHQPADSEHADFFGSLSSLRRLAERSPARFVVTSLSLVSAFLFFPYALLLEVGLGWPIAWWLYAAMAALIATALVLWRPFASWPARLITFAALLATMAILSLAPWNGTKTFLQDLYRIEPGMTEADVHRIMARYPEGTGWPAVDGGTPDGAGTLVDGGTGAAYATGSTPAGQMTINNSLVFRPLSDGPGDCNWGVVRFENGKVVGVSFSPD